MIVGLTGGICSGKTEAAQELAHMGVRVIDADEISRFLTHYNPNVLAQIEQCFGTRVFTPFGALDRQKLADIVFNDEQERETLEAILHPPVIELQDENIAIARENKRHLVISAPLMIESGIHKQMDHVVLVACSKELQEQRLIMRSHLSPLQAKNRIKSQLPLEVKQKSADTVINNSGTLDEFRLAIRKVFTYLFEQESNA